MHPARKNNGLILIAISLVLSSTSLFVSYFNQHTLLDFWIALTSLFFALVCVIWYIRSKRQKGD